MSPDSKTVCPACGGRKTVAVATEDVECSTCDGKGTITAAVAKQIGDKEPGEG